MHANTVTFLSSLHHFTRRWPVNFPYQKGTRILCTSSFDTPNCCPVLLNFGGHTCTFGQENCLAFPKSLFHFKHVQRWLRVRNCVSTEEPFSTLIYTKIPQPQTFSAFQSQKRMQFICHSGNTGLLTVPLYYFVLYMAPFRAEYCHDLSKTCFSYVASIWRQLFIWSTTRLFYFVKGWLQEYLLVWGNLKKEWGYAPSPHQPLTWVTVIFSSLSF